MKKQNDLILEVLNVLSWIIFIGLCVEAGALVYKLIMTFIKPVAAQSQSPHFMGAISFALAIAILKAYLFYLVVRIFMKLNLVKPFTIEIAKMIEKISYKAFAIAIVGVIAHQYTKRFIESDFDISNLEKHWNDTEAYLIMAAIIFVISQIFIKGVELQNENDLTV